MATGFKSLEDGWLQSSQARRLGFKANRLISVREHALSLGKPQKAVHGSLASILAAGYITAVSHGGMPLLIGPDRKQVYDFDEQKGCFIKTSIKHDTASVVEWGCITPMFSNLDHGEPHQRQLPFGAVACVSQNRLSFETMTCADLPDFRQYIGHADDCTGLEDGEPYFNQALSSPISVSKLSDVETFRTAFPVDDDIERVRSACASGSTEALDNHDDQVAKLELEPIGRIVISYRHQEHGANRITFDDWLCGCSTLRLVCQAYGWERVRFWTDARLRLLKAYSSFDVTWAQIGLLPYTLGPVVVLNFSRKSSITDRFWLTVERKSGAHRFGTWLTDDAGDIFFYKNRSDEDLYSRAIVTAVSTSQGITWPLDRQDILEVEWEMLEVDNVSEALSLLREPQTFEAREDFLSEELYDIQIAPKGKTMQWWGDVEALIDPPSLVEVFGSAGEPTYNMKMRALETEIFLCEMRTIVVVQQSPIGSKVEFITKRLFVDADGEIRARSVPRLVDEDYIDGLIATGKVRELDIKKERPMWISEAALLVQ